MENTNPKPQRRVRYKGTHPKAFQEKYKELQPEQYAADIEKVIQKGRTPAGMHLSICVNEIMEFLQIQPGQIGLDATLGYGGHSKEILTRLTPGGLLYAIDVDPIELPKTTERLAALGFGPDVLITKKMNFSDIDQVTVEEEIFNFVLADLGLSSMQIDNPERGFSLKAAGPLDLRLNPKSGKPASAILPHLSQGELQEILWLNADEPYAEIIAEAIVGKFKKGGKIETTATGGDAKNEASTYHIRIGLPPRDVPLSTRAVFRRLSPPPLEPHTLGAAVHGLAGG
jgi:16S rRNA (cytosine1402-N4)-methyltransferase